MPTNVPVCDLCDAHPERLTVLDPAFIDLGGRTAFAGPAATVVCFEDNSMVREACQEPGNGRVLVVDGGGSRRRSLLGGDLAAKAAENGWAGVIVNGAVRDAAELSAINLGVKALGLYPVKTVKRGLGERDVSARMPGGVTINPGDWIYADRDGVAVGRAPVHED